MRITVCGAAGEVTGSGYLVETGRARVLVDFGMFQGRRATDKRNADLGPVDPREVDAVVLTHAHLDHSGRLPLLGARGLTAPIYGTAATDDFAQLILEDSAAIQEGDAKRMTKTLRRAGRKPAKPLYTRQDVEALRPRFTALGYDETRDVAPGVTVRLVEAGHILGSTSVEMRAEGRTVVFSGDIGPKGAPFLRDPVPLANADLVFLESTYGGRDHRSLDATIAEFQEVLEHALQQEAKVLIPAFSIGRSQLILFYLAELRRLERIPPIPIYLDSPMAIKATRLYGKYQHLFDKESTALVKSGRLRKDLASIHFLEKASDSRRLNRDSRSGVVIAGSGMCNGGRILHHLKHHLWREDTHVVFVGYQAEGTLGRALVDGAERVRVLGQRVHVAARIHTIGGFSAHAGQRELVEWVEPLMPARVVLTHGEPDSREALATVLRERFDVSAEMPLRGDVIEL